MSHTPEGPQTAGERAGSGRDDLIAELIRHAQDYGWVLASNPDILSDQVVAAANRVATARANLESSIAPSTGNGSIDSLRLCASRCASPRYLCELQEGHDGNHAAFVTPGRGQRVEWLDGAALSSTARGEPAAMADANDRFEELAAEFHRETGMLAPGKDQPAAFGTTPSYEERQEAWKAWCGSRTPGRVIDPMQALRDSRKSFKSLPPPERSDP